MANTDDALSLVSTRCMAISRELKIIPNCILASFLKYSSNFSLMSLSFVSIKLLYGQDLEYTVKTKEFILIM